MTGSEQQRFRVSVNVQVQQLRPPYPDAPPEQWQPTSYPGLEVREGYDVTAGGFMEVAAILGRFHELADQLQEKGPSDGR